jgi:MoaA/NifB/PqqE/SkfB family radical SAM enzyme
MKSFDFSKDGTFSIESFGVIKPKELVYLRLPSLADVLNKDCESIKSLTAQTSRVMISIPSGDASNESFFDKITALGVNGVSLRFSYDSKKWLSQVGFGSNHSGDRDVIEQYQQHLRLKPRHVELVAELEMEDDSRLLGPTIAGLHSSGCPWVLINVPEVPNTLLVRKLAEMFEYLKIRNLTRLNVYFPFWLSSNEEWNVKTQNTFSGLSEVHIDLSNKCTHSCVFCGLYAPESVNEIKARHDGKLPKQVIDHMSKEIKYERCLEFIETLPWTVRQIQFGGLGDPLMHKHAVDLIRAARERGFYVEMLSNMDYLSHEDIRVLHDLGGANFHDLHFIANVSGGDVDTYIATRPKQTVKSFDNVKQTLMTLSKLRTVNEGVGVNFTIMCVVNKHNCSALEKVASYAHTVGARKVWFKPMEVHGDYHKRILPEHDQLISMAKSLEAAIEICDSRGIIVFEREFCVSIIKQYKELADVK